MKTVIVGCGRVGSEVAVNLAAGVATAAGCQLVATCDLAVAADEAGYGHGV